MDIPYGDCFTVNTRWELRPALAGEPGGGDGGGGGLAGGALAAAVPDASAAGGLAWPPRLKAEMYLRVAFSRTCLFKKVGLGGRAFAACAAAEGGEACFAGALVEAEGACEEVKDVAFIIAAMGSGPGG
eukprot:232937-Chlamydomonas_euryale.AAC.1